MYKSPAHGRDKSVPVLMCVCIRATSPKAILGHMPRWQQTANTVTRTGDRVKQFDTQQVLSALQAK